MSTTKEILKEYEKDIANIAVFGEPLEELTIEELRLVVACYAEKERKEWETPLDQYCSFCEGTGVKPTLGKGTFYRGNSSEQEIFRSRTQVD